MLSNYFVYKYLFLFSLCCAIFLISLCIKLWKKGNPNKSKSNSIDLAIRLSANYLLNSVSPTGKFLYIINLHNKKTYDDIYNPAHHALAIYALHLIEKHSYYSSNIQELQVKRYLAADFFIEKFIMNVSENMIAVPIKSGDENNLTNIARPCDTGAALIGLSHLYSEGKVNLGFLRNLGNFILFMQTKNGAFCHSFNFSENEKTNAFSTHNNAGEACLGLLHLYLSDNDEKWLTSAKKGLLLIASKSNEKSNDENINSQAIISIKKLFSIENNGVTPVEKLLFQKYIKNQVIPLMEKQITAKKNSYSGAFIDNVRLREIAKIMEGLCAAYYCIDDDDLKFNLMKALHLGNSLLTNYQVKNGNEKMIGAIPDNVYWQHKNAPAAARAVRLDNIQHTLCAWINFQALFTNSK